MGLYRLVPLVRRPLYWRFGFGKMNNKSEDKTMKIEIDIDTENAAFDNMESELLDILTTVIQKVSSGNNSGRCMDSNGNSVGNFKVS